MNALSIRGFEISLRHVALYFTLGIISVFFGMAAAVLPPTFLIVVMSMPIIFFMAFAFPSLTLAASLVLMFGLLPSSVFATLPLGNASVRPPELILLLLFFILAFRSLGEWNSIVAPARPILFPLTLFAIGFFIAIFKGKLLQNNPQALAEARQYFGWLVLPLALWISKYKPGQLHRLVMTIALIAASAMVFQLASGIQIIYGFRGAEELSKEFRDITRSAIGGGTLFLCYAAYYLFGSYCNNSRNRTWLMLGLLILLGGIAATFSRSVWGGIMVGGLGFLSLTPKFKTNKIGLVILLLAIISMLAIVLALASPRVGEAIQERVLSVAEEGKKGSSIGFRLDENSQALNAIRQSPIFGIGLGGRYKQVYRQAQIGGGFDIEESFIHNAYLALWMKIGIFGILFSIALIFSIYLSLKKLPKSKYFDGDTSVIRIYASVSALIMMYVESFTSPDWSQQGHIAAAAVLLAILLTDVHNKHSMTTIKNGI